MFEAPYNSDASSYTFYISYDCSDSNTTYLSKTEHLPITLVKDLEIGKKYKWHVSTLLKNGETKTSSVYHFSILNSVLTDPKKFKTVQHYHKKAKVLDGVIWCDQYRCAVDRNGKIVWFVPDGENDYRKTNAIRDLKLNDDGNLTLLNHPNAILYDLNFNPLWKAPVKGFMLDSAFNGYHHAFQKLENGHYIILANEKVNFADEGNTTKTENIDFCNIVEFDANGKIVWFWLMKEHFPYELLINSKLPSENGIVNPHANSFTLDEKNDVIYLGFRNLNRVIKIDRKTKKILASYGTRLDGNDDIHETDLFKLQHDIQYLGNNDFLMFNNNDINNGKISSVDIIHFPIDKKDSYRLKYSFPLNYDSYTNGKVEKMGGVKKLPNNNYLISEGSSNRISEISQNKEILWDFSLQQLDSSGKANPKFGIYRAYYSSSLYPHYFSAYANPHNLIIVNKGSENDSYKIEFLHGEGAKTEMVTKTVSANSALTLQQANLNSYNRIIISSLRSGKKREINLDMK